MKELASPTMLVGSVEGLLDVLFGEDWRTCGHPAHDGQRDEVVAEVLGHLCQPLGLGLLLLDDLDGAGLLGVPADEPLLLELLEVHVNRGGGGQPDRGAYLPDRRWVGVLLRV